MAESPRIIYHLSRSYWMRLTRGYTPDEARSYIATEYGATDPADVEAAVQMARRGEEISARLNMLDQDVPFGSIFDPDTVPGSGFTARVNISYTTNKQGQRTDKYGVSHATFFTDLTWEMTRSQLLSWAESVMETFRSMGYDLRNVAVQFEGPQGIGL